MWMERGTEPVLPDNGWHPITLNEWQDQSRDVTVVEIACPNGWRRVHIDNLLVKYGRRPKQYIVEGVRAEMDNWINETSRTWREDRDW